MRILLISLLSFCSVYSQTTDPLLSTDYAAQQKWVDSVYNQMTFNEKVGQLFMVAAYSNKDSILVSCEGSSSIKKTVILCFLCI